MTIVNICKSSSHALYLCQVLGNYRKRYQSYKGDTISILKITKGNGSAKNVDGATVVNIYMSSGYAFCAKFRESISNGIKVIERTQFLYGNLQRGIIPQKCRWSDHCHSLHVVW